MFTGTCLLLSAVLLVVCRWAHSAHVILMPLQARSHMAYFISVGKGLVDNGHQVSLLVAEGYPVPQTVADAEIRVLEYKTQGHDMATLEMQFNRDLVEDSLNRYTDQLSVVLNFLKSIEQQCEFIMNDSDILAAARTADFILQDGVPLGYCYSLLPYKLRIPFGTLSTQFDPMMTRTLALPSLIPIQLFPQTDRLNFKERFSNFAFLVIHSLFFDITKSSNKLLWKYIPDEANEIQSMFKLSQKSVLFLYNLDPVLDYPRPVWPNTVLVGGLTTQPAKPLPERFRRFLGDWHNGGILVSFGTIATYFPQEINLKLLKVFEELDMAVIWKYNGPKLESIPRNVLVQEWIPQNDLLGDPAIKLFVTHCGNNGQYEALYHGMPMVGLPVFGDQTYNAARMQHKEFGLYLDIVNFTSDALLANIKQVLEDPKYRNNIMKASKAFRDQPHPRERAAFWVEHVIKYGGRHLTPSAMSMPWYRIVLLDVIAVMFALVLCVCIILYCFCKMAYKWLSQSRPVNSKLKKQ